ncbi:MAG: hypothetical protein ABI397_01725, partial [Candidatus Saccharimonas sp.]
MYAGTTFRKSSGQFIGVHQRIDRIARKNLNKQPGIGAGFPRINEILHFEGNNGPDGIKRKSPSVDEPWHYIDPTNPNDRELITTVNNHYANLVEALKTGNNTRAAFEAAWMSHAIADGLTPAHHFPLSDKIEELWGKPKEQRLTIIEKNFIKGISTADTISKNWEYWGAKGVFLTHIMFELGVASSVKSIKVAGPLASYEWLEEVKEKSIEEVFLD